MLTRRNVVLASAAAALIPGWARGDGAPSAALSGEVIRLTVDRAPIAIDGKRGRAIAVNGMVPGPLIRLREGQDVSIRVENKLDEDTSIHWHGLILPFTMDGVPGVSYPGIRPGETFVYQFKVRQSGTYWYHSHSGLQEQVGVYGPLVIDPAAPDPVRADREHVLVLSDWTFRDPHALFHRLKKESHGFDFQKLTALDLARDIGRRGAPEAISDRRMWAMMRMSPTDIADVTGAEYRYLLNGRGAGDGHGALYAAGEAVRLRIINASAMTIFNFRIPGLPMTVVAADGVDVVPLETDEFQIGVAETYDVVVSPGGADYGLVAESIDRSGVAFGTLTTRAGARAAPPALRARPILTHRDMGMTHEGHGGGHEGGSHEGGAHDGGGHEGHAAHEAQARLPVIKKDVSRGPGVDMIADAPTRRVDDPGLGLPEPGKRALRYSELEIRNPMARFRAPAREIELHLTGNMERYMWSFDGEKFSHVKDAIQLIEGERVRFTLVNDTMMTHPIHLHGMFFDLVNGKSERAPKKHTVNVKPGEMLSFDVDAEHVGDWAFHCHLLFHMHAGMMQVVTIRPRPGAAPPDAPAGAVENPNTSESRGGHH